jgi:hypothetical protein
MPGELGSVFNICILCKGKYQHNTPEFSETQHVMNIFSLSQRPECINSVLFSFIFGRFSLQEHIDLV